MEAATFGVVLTTIVVAVSVTWVAKLLNTLWFRPRKLEKLLREQGFEGNPYRLLLGDTRDYIKAVKEEQPRSIPLSDEIMPHVFAYEHRIISKYGPNSFYWLGPSPRLNVTDPKLIKDILRRTGEFEKPSPETGKILTGGGLLFQEGQKWVQRRKIVNHAFHLDKLKNMVPAMGLSCSHMIQKLKGEVANSSNPSRCEIDMWPYLKDLTGDVISRTVFGSGYEEAKRVFQLQSDRVELVLQLLQFSHVPGWSYLPTKLNRKVKSVTSEIKTVLRGVMENRAKTMERGDEDDDLLSILMEANTRLSEEEGKENDGGMSIEDVMEECQLFYFAGSDTVASLLVWTMVMLCSHPEWQTQAREEIIRVFGKSDPTPQGLNHLKTVTMILQEVLRMYPPAPGIFRSPKETVKIGSVTIPAGVQLAMMIGHVHYDPRIWGDDVKEFKPQRFASNQAASASLIPFSSGPRICIGHNFAMTETKIVIAMLLQHFSMELSPSYKHAPFAILALQPHYGAPIILRHLHQ